jgi:hypothetical protein
MISLRVTVSALVVLLVLAPCLGFAAGEAAPPVPHKHSSHGPGRGPGGSRAIWTSTPGTPVVALPAVVLSLVGRLSSSRPLVVASPMLRPPFVPPRA